MPACAFLRASVGSTEYDGVASTHSAEQVEEEQVERAAAALTCVSRLKKKAANERDACRHSAAAEHRVTVPVGPTTIHL